MNPEIKLPLWNYKDVNFKTIQDYARAAVELNRAATVVPEENELVNLVKKHGYIGLRSGTGDCRVISFAGMDNFQSFVAELLSAVPSQPVAEPVAPESHDPLSMEQVMSIKGAIRGSSGWDRADWDYALANAAFKRGHQESKQPVSEPVQITPHELAKRIASGEKWKLADEPVVEPVAMRYDFDGHGYRYIDNGSGSDWKTRHPDAEALFTHPSPDARDAAMGVAK